MKKISIITPVYNTAEYLDECFGSIEKQTIDKSLIEVIIINDGSTDNSLEIINQYLKKHSNWHLINQHNQGQSISRNNAISRAKGEYITFLDSDDYLREDALEVMLKAANNDDIDLVVSKLVKFDSKGKYPYYSDKVLKKERTFTFSEYLAVCQAMALTSKLYKKELIKDIKFIPNVKHEDNYFSLLTFYKAKKIHIIPKGLYFRRMRESENKSIMQSLTLNSFKDIISNYKLFFEKTHFKNKYLTNFCLKKANNYIIKNLKYEDHGEAFEIYDLFVDHLVKKQILTKSEKTYYTLKYRLYRPLAKIYLKIEGALK